MRTELYNWDGFLTYARQLCDTIETETSFRIAISRAYYAAYWKARLLLEMNEAPMPAKNEHAFVWDCYTVSKNARGMPLNMPGFKLRGLRNDADYDASTLILKTDAERAIMFAEKIYADISGITGSAKQAAVSRAKILIDDPRYR